jgi:cytochrome c-type biogenesis protein
MLLSALFAFLAGIVTVAAPCTLPVLPILLGASLAGRGKARPLFIAGGFVASFAAVTLAFSAVARVAGLAPDQLRNVAIVLLALFGVLLLWPQAYAQLTAAASGLLGRAGSAAPRNAEGTVGGFLLGCTLGLVWTPCAGPVLGSILTLVATQAQPGWAATLLTLYAVGAAVPMLAIAYGGQLAAARVRTVAAYAPRLQQAFGVIIVGFAAAMYFQYDTALTAWLTQFYSSAQIGL